MSTTNNMCCTNCRKGRQSGRGAYVWYECRNSKCPCHTENTTNEKKCCPKCSWKSPTAPPVTSCLNTECECHYCDACFDICPCTPHPTCLCPCHAEKMTDTAQWEEQYDGVFKLMPKHDRVWVKEFIRRTLATERSTARAMLETALEHVKSLHVIAKKSYPSESWDAGYHDALFAAEKRILEPLTALSENDRSSGV